MTYLGMAFRGVRDATIYGLIAWSCAGGWNSQQEALSALELPAQAILRESARDQWQWPEGADESVIALCLPFAIDELRGGA